MQNKLFFMKRAPFIYKQGIQIIITYIIIITVITNHD